MQLDHFLPTYEFDEIHSVNIDAPPERVYQALKNLTIAEISQLVSLMFQLRSLPARLTGKAFKASFHPGPILDQMYQRGFLFLSETADCELVFGLVGRFWELSGGKSPAVSSPEAFLAFDDPTFAKGAANFLVTKRNQGRGSRYSTETQVCLLLANHFHGQWIDPDPDAHGDQTQSRKNVSRQHWVGDYLRSLAWL
jgi:hypothetical protein